MKTGHIKTTVIFLTLTLTLFVLGLGSGLAGGNEPVPEWFFDDLVDAEFVKQHVAVPMPENEMIIDARPFKPKYVKGHIPMAVNIPFTDKLASVRKTVPDPE